ncbi:hypothetical protein ACFSJS_16635 [Streptomyces desertarenae]|uniref:Uncharacterized protein n=1 Tax=Streptomyces desertarenae TaxID=2666184 RepID=A0ABW4PLV7_9ACTN
MPSLRHTVTLEPVPRRWVEDVVVSLHRLLEELHPENGVLHFEGDPVPGIRHTAGRHLAPGARYEVVGSEGGGGPTVEAGDGTAGEAGTRGRLLRSGAARPLAGAPHARGAGPVPRP